VLNSSVYPIHLDPAWVKEKMKEGNMEEFKKYMQYIFSDALKVFHKERPAVLFTTPKIIEIMIEHPGLKVEDLQSQLKGIMFGGMEMKKDTYRLLDEEIFPDIPIMGLYGNTLFGASFQAPPNSNYDIDYFPQSPQVSFEVINPESKKYPEILDYGERGQVMFHRLMPDVLLFNKVERDLATKISGKEHKDVLEGIYKDVREVVGVRNVENIKAQTPDGKPTLGVY